MQTQKHARKHSAFSVCVYFCVYADDNEAADSKKKPRKSGQVSSSNWRRHVLRRT